MGLRKGLALLLVSAACVAGTKPAPVVDTVSTPCGPRSNFTRFGADVRWDDFVQLGDRRYSAALPTTLAIDQLEEVVAKVCFSLRDRGASNPEYKAQDGDAAYLAEGTELRRVGSYEPWFRVGVADHDGKAKVYTLEQRTSAKRGRDLLDVRGRVARVIVRQESTPLAVIDDPKRVERMVGWLLAGRVVETPRDPQGRRYFVALELADGSEVSRPIWVDDRVFWPSILVAPAFIHAVENAIGQ